MSKTQQYIGVAFFVAVLLLMFNWFASQSTAQIDFTQEKQFTLTNATKQLLKDIDEPVTVYVFLEGNQLPSAFKRLQFATKNLLNNFRKQSKGKLNIIYENPLEGLSPKERQETLYELQQRGITPTNVRIKTKDGVSENLIFPGALIEINDRQFPVMLLTGQRGQQDINRSIELLEFQFANALSKLQKETIGTIGFLQGHGELSPIETLELRKSLGYNYYKSVQVDLDDVETISNAIQLLIIARPEQAFSKSDKFKIDQYIMNGGKVIWSLDMMKMNLDSLRTVWGGKNVAVDFNLNLDDQLFKYGARINRNFIRDLQSKPIPVVIDDNGQTQLFPWTFFPVISSKDEHITTKNISPVSFEFVSSLDTVAVPSVKKTILLSSSSDAGLVANPVLVDLEELRNPPPNAVFALQHLPTAVLLEGEFTSLFQHRAIPMNEWPNEKKNHSIPTKQVVISDGDIFKNDVGADGRTFPLGYDRSINEQFGNQEFALNIIDYLMNDQPVLEARNKQVQLRLLNQTKVEEEKGKWQRVAFLVPISVLLLLTFCFWFIRRKRFR